MSVLTLRPPAREYDPLLDKTYRGTALGVDVVAWLAWLELGGTADRTLDQYERDLSRACLMYPETSLEGFDDAMMAHVARSFPQASRRVRVASYRSFFNWAARTRRIVAKPTDALPVMKRRPQKVFDLFTDVEQSVLCSLPARDGALMTLMLETGARKGDCRALQFRHWRADQTADAPYGLVVFLWGKGGKDRQVPATELVARRLSELAILDGVGDHDHLWYTRPGGGSLIDRSRPIGDGSFDRWWRRSLELAGVRYRNPHTTRHTFATEYLRRGGRLSTLKRVLGHESISTTEDLYSHLELSDVSADMRLVKEVIA